MFSYPNGDSCMASLALLEVCSSWLDGAIMIVDYIILNNKVFVAKPVQ